MGKMSGQWGPHLISTETLAEVLRSSGCIVIDCRFDLQKPDAGQAQWSAGHIPGARYAHLDADLASPRRPDSGRHPLPDPAHFAARLGQWGVTPATQVVVYDAAGGAIAARLWWLLRWVGHQQVALLDGGLPAWQAAGLPLEVAAEREPGDSVPAYPVRPGSMPVVTSTDVESGLRADALRVIDARDAKRFSGEVEPIDLRAGHVPGAQNWPFTRNLDADGRFLPSQALRERFNEWLGDPKPPRLASMCGSGVTACHTLFALEYAGVTAELPSYPALYVGSWSEWIVDPSRPVASGISDNPT